MAVREDCKHYILQTVGAGDRVERCKLNANQQLPFACPDDCIFFEARTGISKIGWKAPNLNPSKKPPANPED